MYGMIADLPERPRAKLVRQIGSALGIPAEVLLLNFESSYSASRGALLEAWKTLQLLVDVVGNEFLSADL